VHDLLVAAGPPEELPPSLAQPPSGRRGGRVVSFPGPRRRLGAGLAHAAAIAVALVGGGDGAGAQKHAVKSEEAFVMRGPSPSAFASIKMAAMDSAHNWPLLVDAHGLKDLPEGGYYELLLTRDGKLGPSCGTFRTHRGAVTIELNAPYDLRKWNGWVVVAHTPAHRSSPPVLTTHLS
jgi:hypothetical protein